MNEYNQYTCFDFCVSVVFVVLCLDRSELYETLTLTFEYSIRHNFTF